jgi:ribosomal protein L37AE/L43A
MRTYLPLCIAIAFAAGATGLVLLTVVCAAFARGRDVSCCSVCDSDDIKRSSARCWTDVMLDLFACVPYRCRSCGERFYGPEPSVGAKRAASQGAKDRYAAAR